MLTRVVPFVDSCLVGIAIHFPLGFAHPPWLQPICTPEKALIPSKTGLLVPLGRGALTRFLIGTRYAGKLRVQKQVPISTVLRVQSIGFLVIIAFSWFDEFINLRSLIFGNHPYISDFRESAMEMLLVLTVWFLVVRATRRVIQRVHYLEGFPRVCAWCHHISYKSMWVRPEEFLKREFDTPTTHGICPTCAQKQKAAIEEARRSANESKTRSDHSSPGAATTPT